MTFNNSDRVRGFSLIELMVVVAIIAILAAIALPLYDTHAQRSRLVVAKTMLTAARQELQTMFLERKNWDDKTKLNVNANSDYNRYFTVQISKDKTKLTATPSAGNKYKGMAQIEIGTGIFTYDCKGQHSNACQRMLTDKKDKVGTIND